MTPSAEIGFFNTVVSRLDEADKFLVSRWAVDHLCSSQSTEQEVNAAAQKILIDMGDVENNSQRYRFRDLQARDLLLKKIFEKSFLIDSMAVIRAAESLNGSSVYPLWRGGCLIDISQNLGNFLGNTWVRIAIATAAAWYIYKLGDYAFTQMVHFFAAKVIPFIINNTPIGAIHVGNQILNVVNWGCHYALTILIGLWIIKWIILRGPVIPYVTPALESIHIGSIVLALCNTPQTLSQFLGNYAMEGARFVWHNSNNLSFFFTSISTNAKKNYLATSKLKAYAVWRKAISKMRPQVA